MFCFRYLPLELIVIQFLEFPCALNPPDPPLDLKKNVSD